MKEGKEDFEKLAAAISDWHKATFPEAKEAGQVLKLDEEFNVRRQFRQHRRIGGLFHRRVVFGRTIQKPVGDVRFEFHRRGKRKRIGRALQCRRFKNAHQSKSRLERRRQRILSS